MDYQEIAPGVADVDGVLKLCPGCGMEVVGGDHNDPEDVQAWFLAVFYALTTFGATGFTPERAMSIAADYSKSPWHMKEGEGNDKRPL